MTLPHVRSICLIANPEKEAARREFPRLKSFLKKNHLKLLTRNYLAQADVLMTIGGDGTILSAASEAAQLGIPVFGINVGRLGFMTTIGLPDFYRKFPNWMKGHWPIEERMMLSVSLPRSKKVGLALNDAVIRIGAISRVTRLYATIENEPLGFFTGDGLIVATSTGSTAYSLSANGPVVHPNLDALILTPICAHSFSQRPVVFPANQTLEITLQDHRKDNEVQLCLDGQRVFPLHSGDRIRVTSAVQKLKIYQNPASTYFGMLREKLQWGGR